MKECTRCAGRFDRLHAPRRKLKDGSVIDPDELCPSCEEWLAREAVAAHDGPSPEDIARWQQLCLRKDAFEEAYMARLVAKRMRRRHRGTANPVHVYRCREAVDPVMFPERAHVHWHIGGAKPS